MRSDIEFALVTFQFEVDLFTLFMHSENSVHGGVHYNDSFCFLAKEKFFCKYIPLF